jgi:hypothetical protein
MKNLFKKEQEEQLIRRPRIRNWAFRRAMERLDEAVMQAEEIKSKRLQQLEDMEQGWRIEYLRERLFGTEIARAAK